MAVNRKEQTGVVLSRNMSKSAVVRIEWREREAEYGKVISRRKKFMVHDPKETCREGDTVLIGETRPVSRLKRWVVLKVIQRAPVLEAAPKSKAAGSAVKS